MFNVIETLRNGISHANYYPTISAVKWHFTSA